MNENTLKQKRILGLSLGILLLVTNVVAYLTSFLIGKANLVTEQNQYIITYVMNALCIYVIGYSIFRLVLKKVDSAEKQEKKKLKFGEFIIIAIATIGGAQFINVIFQVILILIKSLLNIEIDNRVTEIIQNSNPILSAIFVAILGPIVEELMFRGTLLKKVRPYGDKTAVIYTAIAFGLFHCNIEQIPYTIAVGLVLGYSFVRTNNIIYPIILHIMLNSISVILSTLLKYNLTIPMVIVEFLIIILIILALIFIPIKLTSGKVKISNESKYDKKNLYKNIGYISTVIIVIAVTVLEAIIQ